MWKDLEQAAKCRPFLQQTSSGQQLTGSGVLRLAGEVENLVQFHPGVIKKKYFKLHPDLFDTKKEIAS